MSNLALYELDEKELELQDRIEEILIRNEGVVDDTVEELEDALALTRENVKEKLDGYYKILRNFETHAENLREEAGRLEDRADKAEKAKDWLEGNVEAYMHKREEDEIQTEHTTFRHVNVGGKRKLELTADDEAYPHETKKWTYRVKVKGDKIDPDTKERIDEIMDELRELGVNISVREKVLKSRVRELGDEALMRLKPRGKKLKY